MLILLITCTFMFMYITKFYVQLFWYASLDWKTFVSCMKTKSESKLNKLKTKYNAIYSRKLRREFFIKLCFIKALSLNNKIQISWFHKYLLRCLLYMRHCNWRWSCSGEYWRLLLWNTRAFEEKSGQTSWVWSHSTFSLCDLGKSFCASPSSFINRDYSNSPFLEFLI